MPNVLLLSSSSSKVHVPWGPSPISELSLWSPVPGLSVVFICQQLQVMSQALTSQSSARIPNGPLYLSISVSSSISDLIWPEKSHSFLPCKPVLPPPLPTPSFPLTFSSNQNCGYSLWLLPFHALLHPVHQVLLAEHLNQTPYLSFSISTAIISSSHSIITWATWALAIIVSWVIYLLPPTISSPQNSQSNLLRTWK